MFPITRMRRLRRTIIRPLVQETHLRVDDLICPLFFDETITAPILIPSMPGQHRYPVSMAGDIVHNLFSIGIRAILLFGIPKHKDSVGTSAYDENGIVQRVVREIKKAVPNMVVITDLCACEYTDHGHCGILESESAHAMNAAELDNDKSLILMEKIAISHAQAGADIVAPSSMLDGVVRSMRSALDREGYSKVCIMAYSSKFASTLYGPFRDAADSGYSYGDRKGYQAPITNRREAYRESELDALEGADFLMVKPAGWAGDIVSDICAFNIPVVAYQVSGEYAMIMAACERGWLQREVIMESLLSLKRAGASLIITYFAEEVAKSMTGCSDYDTN
ncbi:MAG: porphobilinogen synthase [Euryarchaeota archaeon]|nr:porphobilinogen synthase [Euryarchaeota archaeon]